jgi:hypothetical protein
MISLICLDADFANDLISFPALESPGTGIPAAV